MSDKRIYIITTYNGSDMYRYLFEYKYIEYYQEEPEKSELVKAFHEKSGIGVSEIVIDIEVAPYIRFIKHE